MTPQTGVFPRIHTSYNIYELLIHEMTHDTANEGDPGLVPRSAPTRRRSGAAPARARSRPARSGARSRDGHATSWSGGGISWDEVPAAPSPPDGISGASGPAAPTPNLRRYRTKDLGIAPPSPPARRAVVIGLQPAVNGRGYGLYV